MVSNSDTIKRKRSMVKPERARSARRGMSYEAVEENGTITLRRRSIPSLPRNITKTDTILRRALGKQTDKAKLSWWVIMSRVVTCCCPPFLLRACGKRDPQIQQAFREKLTLCFIIFLLMVAVGFLTFGFQEVICGKPGKSVKLNEMTKLGVFSVRGLSYTVPVHPKGSNVTNDGWAGVDFARMFQKDKSVSLCKNYIKNGPVVPCNIEGLDKFQCHNNAKSLGFPDYPLNVFKDTFQGEIYTNWTDVLGNKDYIVFSSNVLKVAPWATTKIQLAFLPPKLLSILESHLGKDATAQIFWNKFEPEARCVTELYKIGKIDSQTANCVFTDVVLNISLVVIGGVVIVRFVLAVLFAFVMGWRLGERGQNARSAEQIKRRREEWKNRQKNKPEGHSDEFSSKENIIPLKEISSGDDAHKHHKFSSRFSSVPASDGMTKSSSYGLPVSLPGKDGNDKKAHHMYGTREPTLPDVQFDGLARSDSTITDDRSFSPDHYFQDLSIPVPEIENDPVLNDPTLMHTLMMVPCYSEGVTSLRTTLDSVSNTYYPATHKCLIVVADGIIQGAGNAKPTSDILVDMMEVDERFRKEDPRYGGEPEAYSYVAIADGAKRKNFAKVYAGWYKHANEGKTKNRRKTMLFQGLEDLASKFDHDDMMTEKDMRFGTIKAVKNRKGGKVPMILIVKCGNEEERDPEKKVAKPGNRGKRDSQVILMNFLSKVMFDDRMTELEFDLFFKLWTITGVHPERYETVLFVDADTMVYPDSLTHMVAVMLADNKVMGLCGETKIANKWKSWVSMIQVFEYYISHHLSKAFESVFGGVTCLPGCFSMLRIKAPKGNGYYVPILANPDIVEEYSENVVDTLHKKNLLLLGEDRYLSTLFLRTFPKRKMVFVPLAICKTIVPDEFRVLLSQRRRWINSTIHNLLELLLVPDLCGTFCISMQFVIFMELVGTVVLPAAISFTIYVVVKSVTSGHPEVVPLLLLAAILGLPAVLIVLTASRLIYVFWMFMYLLSLPVWNFVLPLYAFWHFDDFSWGETRKTISDSKHEDHGRRVGEFDGSGINMRKWTEWMQDRKLEAERAQAEREAKKKREELETKISLAKKRKSLFIAAQPVPQQEADAMGLTGNKGNRKSMIVSSIPPGAQVIMSSRSSIANLTPEQLEQLQQGQNFVTIGSSSSSENNGIPAVPSIPMHLQKQPLQRQQSPLSQQIPDNSPPEQHIQISTQSGQPLPPGRFVAINPQQQLHPQSIMVQGSPVLRQGSPYVRSQPSPQMQNYQQPSPSPHLMYAPQQQFHSQQPYQTQYQNQQQYQQYPPQNGPARVIHWQNPPQQHQGGYQDNSQ
ncbi:Chitin synthase, class 3 [Nowakowskiella sp. JEL0407]|nr:Chitin synthase, class 3 [Nowakowskiella sp. JEL0407]